MILSSENCIKVYRLPLAKMLQSLAGIQHKIEPAVILSRRGIEMQLQ